MRRSLGWFFSAVAVAAAGVAACGEDQPMSIGRMALDGGGDSGGSLGGDGAGGSDLPDAGPDVAVGGQGGEGASAGAGGDCAPLLKPLHRYGFDGNGTEITDSVGAAHGALLGGATLAGSGELSLDGTDDYVDFPNTLLSPLQEVTVCAWVKNDASGPFARIFDFGTGDQGENPMRGVGSVGTKYLALTPSTDVPPHQLTVLLTLDGKDNSLHLYTEHVLDNTMHHACVTMRSKASIALYVDGTALGSIPTDIALSQINDDNTWLGRSQFDQDAFFKGALDDFRIYDSVLSDCQLSKLASLGQKYFEP